MITDKEISDACSEAYSKSIQKNMELLKVGDKVYEKTRQRFGDNVYYNFSVVERLNKTQAILANGKKVINEPTKEYSDTVIGYPTFGDRLNKWYIVTPEILEEAEKEKLRQTSVLWFDNKKFSKEEKYIVYNAFKTLNKLEGV